MANLQYIGARYVPVVYSNPDDNSSNWKSGVSYENLVIVTYQDNSYTSRKPVPSSVGNPASNPEYWAKTGDFNAALTALQNRVDNIENVELPSANTKITDIRTANYLSGKKIVVYGDSSAYVGGGASSYFDYVKNAVGCQLTNRAIPGTNMTTTTNNGVTLISTSSDLMTFDFCFLCYGINEFTNGYSTKELTDALESIVTAVRNKNPNISIIFCLPYYIWNPNIGYVFGENDRGWTMGDYNKFCGEYLDRLFVPHIDFYYRSSCSYTTYTKKLLNDSGGIYVHPNEDFKKELAKIVIEGASYGFNANLHPILTSVDFSKERYALSNAEFLALPNFQGAGTGGNYTGMAIKITAGQTAQSTTKLFPAGKYLLRGITNHPITITIGDDTRAINSGEFEIDFYKSMSNSKIVISDVTSDTIISNFQLFYRSNIKSAVYPFGGMINPTLTISTTIVSQPVPLKCHYTESGLYLKSFGLKVNDSTSLNANDVIYTLPDDIQIGDGQHWLIGHAPSSSNTDVFLLVLENNTIKASNVPANGTYFFTDVNLDVTMQNYT